MFREASLRALAGESAAARISRSTFDPESTPNSATWYLGGDRLRSSFERAALQRSLLPEVRSDDVGVAGLAPDHVRGQDELEIPLLPAPRRNIPNLAKRVRRGEEFAGGQGAENRKAGGGDGQRFGLGVENEVGRAS